MESAHHVRVASAIPAEILINISLFLDRHSLAVSLQVCIAWYQVFISQLWITIAVHPDFVGDDWYSANLDKHSSFVQKLLVTASRPHVHRRDPAKDSTLLMSLGDLKTPVVYPNLRELSMVLLAFKEAIAPRELSFAQFILRNGSSLRDLIFTGTLNTTSILDACEHCPNLQGLTIVNKSPQWPDGWMDRYDSLWSRLLSLSLTGEWISTKEVTLETRERLSKARETRLQTLHLSLKDYRYMK